MCYVHHLRSRINRDKEPRLWRSCGGISQLSVCTDKSSCRDTHGGVVHLEKSMTLWALLAIKMGELMELLKNLSVHWDYG